MNKIIVSFFVLVYLSISLPLWANESEGVDFESQCEREIKKETFNIPLIKEVCLKAAQQIEAEKNYEDVSWYYLLAGEIDYLINKIEPKIPPENRSLENRNLAHNDLGYAYILLGDHINAKKMYQKSLQVNYNLSWLDNMTKMAYHFLEKRYPNKKKKLEQGLQIWNKLYQQLEEAIALNNQGVSYFEQKKYSDALHAFQQSLMIRESILGKKHLHLITNYSNLGKLYAVMGDKTPALIYHLKALDIQESILGKEHSDTADSYTQLGFAYQSLENYPQALIYVQKTLTIREQVLGKQHPDTAVSYIDIGRIYSNMGNYDQALSYFQKALAIQKQALGEQHPDTAISYSHIGGIYNDMGNYDQALDYFHKALAIQKQALGERHPDTVTSYTHIGDIYNDIGNYDKALAYFQEASDKQYINTTTQNSHSETTYNDPKIDLQEILETALDFEGKCLKETKKEVFNIPLIKEFCLKAAKNAEDNKDYNNASWYYLLAGEINYLLTNIQSHISSKNNIGTHANIGYAYVLVEKYTKAEARYHQFLKTVNIDTTWANTNIQDKYLILEKLYPMKQQLKRGLKRWDTIYQPLKEAKQLDEQGFTYTQQGNYSNALKVLQQALAIKEKNLGKQHIDTATSYNSLGFIHHKMREFTQALDYHQQALMINKKVLGEQHLKTAISYNNLGSVYNDIGKFTQALDYFQQALATQEQILGKQHRDTATSYTNLGNTYYQMGEFIQALDYYQRTLDIQEQVLGKQHPDTATSYSNLGFLYYKVADFTQALNYFQRALDIREQVLGKQHPDTALNYNNLGQTYYKIKMFAQAMDYFQRALVINEKAFGKQHSDTATSYNNLGGMYTVIGEFTQAIDYFQQALATREQILGKQHPDTATSYNNLGFLYYKAADFTQALNYFQQALTINKKVLGKQHPTIALNYTNIGSAYSSMGELEQALNYHQQALAINKKVFGTQHPATAINYHTLGRIYYSQKNHTQAYVFNKQAFDNTLQNQTNTFTILSNQQKLNYLANYEYRIDYFLLHANAYRRVLLNNKQTQQTTELVQTTFNDWLAYKGSILDYENLLIQLAKTSPNTTIQEHYKKLIQLKRSYSKRMQTYPETNQEKQWQHLLKQEKDEIDHLEQEIIKLDPQFAEQQQLQTINSQDIAATLAHNELYIDYAKTNVGYYIFTLDSQNNSRFIALDENDAKTIDENIAAFRTEVTQIIDDGKRLEADNKYLATSQAILETLYQLLIEKHLSKQLADKERLIISPDGALRLLPFEALYNEKNKQYFIEQKDIRYIASGKEWMRLQRQVEKHKKAHKTNKANDKPTAVIFANPEFGATNIANTNKPPQIYTRNTDLNTPDCRLSDAISTKFADLPHTDTEANRIIDHLGKPYNRHYYEKTAATEKNLLAIKQPKLLHLATHGFFNEKCPNPMLQSGLVLAGANDSLSHDKTNGIITALDLSGLDLKGTELVVLSACETGVVDPNNTEGVSGLTKAFIQAGASNVIMSLWKVADKDSADLMADFYRIRFGDEKNASYSQALRISKLAMIRNGLHPYYWSGFVLSGL